MLITPKIAIQYPPAFTKNGYREPDSTKDHALGIQGGMCSYEFSELVITSEAEDITFGYLDGRLIMSYCIYVVLYLLCSWRLKNLIEIAPLPCI